MLLFFYGPDNFRIKEKVKKLKEKFISSSLGDTNLVVLDGKTVSYDEIVRQVLAFPFLARKRLVILENLLTSGKSAKATEIQAKTADLLKKIPESTVLVFVEEGLPDKRTALFKRLNQPGQVQEFKLLEGENLKRWLKRTITEKGGEIEALAITKLVDYVGPDLWRMSNEIEKLIAYDKQITTESIELLVQPQTESNIFDLIDATAGKNPRQAVFQLYKLFKNGAAEIYILTMIVFQYRNLLIVKDTQERDPNLSRWELAKKVGLHPFVLGKTIEGAKNYTLREIEKIYRLLLDFESAIKTGKIEPRMGLEMLVYRLTDRKQTTDYRLQQ